MPLPTGPSRWPRDAALHLATSSFHTPLAYTNETQPSEELPDLKPPIKSDRSLRPLCCWGRNLGPQTCKAGALPPSYTLRRAHSEDLLPVTSDFWVRLWTVHSERHPGPMPWEGCESRDFPLAVFLLQTDTSSIWNAISCCRQASPQPLPFWVSFQAGSHVVQAGLKRPM